MLTAITRAAINPITKTSWDGTGVEPDVKVSADDALTTAEKLAADRIHAIKTADHAPPTATPSR
jgi:C-terminal processing protease CtpA/Prc